MYFLYHLLNPLDHCMFFIPVVYVTLLLLLAKKQLYILCWIADMLFKFGVCQQKHLH